MKRFLFLFVAFVIGYIFLFKGDAAGKLEGFDTPASPYVIVYGRDTCSITRSMRKDLESRGIEYNYRKIDDAAVADNLHRKMESLGISTRQYNLPVVEVNARILIRPDVSVVMDAFASN